MDTASLLRSASVEAELAPIIDEFLLRLEQTLRPDDAARVKHVLLAVISHRFNDKVLHVVPAYGANELEAFHNVETLFERLERDADTISVSTADRSPPRTSGQVSANASSEGSTRVPALPQPTGEEFEQKESAYLDVARGVSAALLQGRPITAAELPLLEAEDAAEHYDQLLAARQAANAAAFASCEGRLQERFPDKWAVVLNGCPVGVADTQQAAEQLADDELARSDCPLLFVTIIHLGHHADVVRLDAIEVDSSAVRGGPLHDLLHQTTDPRPGMRCRFAPLAGPADAHRCVCLFDTGFQGAAALRPTDYNLI